MCSFYTTYIHLLKHTYINNFVFLQYLQFQYQLLNYTFCPPPSNPRTYSAVGCYQMCHWHVSIRHLPASHSVPWLQQVCCQDLHDSSLFSQVPGDVPVFHKVQRCLEWKLYFLISLVASCGLVILLWPVAASLTRKWKWFDKGLWWL